jgi:prepilin-type N-terminal cleavage/methylation domain-containing protein
MGRASSASGYTLIEVVLVVVIMGVFVFSAANSYTLAAEQGRVDQGHATLHSVWVAQRLHKLQHGSFASSLDELADALYLERHLDEVDEPFSFEIVWSDADEFIARATRNGSGTWFGQMHLNHNGLSWGSIIGGGKIVSPATLK